MINKINTHVDGLVNNQRHTAHILHSMFPYKEISQIYNMIYMFSFIWFLGVRIGDACMRARGGELPREVKRRKVII